MTALRREWPAPGADPRPAAAPAPGWTTTADVIVVGSGIAGLTCALRLRERVDRVLLVTKTVLSEGSTAVGPGRHRRGARPRGHARGAPRRHPRRRGRAVRRRGRAQSWSPRARAGVRELVALGAEFDRDAERRDQADPRGRPPPRPHRPRRRRRHRRGDLPGADRRAAPRCSRRPRHRGHRARARRRPAHRTTTARVCGVTLHVIGEGQVDGVGAASPGPSCSPPAGSARSTRRRPTRPSRPATAWPPRCGPGRVVADLEFVQFHPTVLLLGEGSTRPAAAHLRGGARRGRVPRRRRRGAVHGGPSTSWPTSRRATSWPGRSSTGCARPAPTTSTSTPVTSAREFLEQRFPSIVARCRELGFDPATELLPVAPAQHYACGGVAHRPASAGPRLDGLYACGEVSCTGVHGANRLASNSLLEGLVFAHRIADDITDAARRGRAAAAPTRVTPAEDAALLDGSAPPRRAARDDPRRRAGALGGVAGRRADDARRPRRRGRRPRPTRAPAPGRRRTCCTSARSSPPWPPARGDPRWPRALGLPRARRRALARPHASPSATADGVAHHVRPPESAAQDPGMTDLALPRRPTPGWSSTAPSTRTSAARRHRRHDVATIPATSRRSRRTSWPGPTAWSPACPSSRSSSTRWPRASAPARSRSTLLVADGDAGRARRRPRHAARARPGPPSSPSAPCSTWSAGSPGVATHTRRWADVLEGTGAMVLDTRKTTPGLRALEKYAVRCGGGTNKRMGLYDVAMIKDNHKLAAGSGSPRPTTRCAQHFPDVADPGRGDHHGRGARGGAPPGARFLLCDNMSTDLLRDTVDAVRAHGRGRSRSRRPAG